MISATPWIARKAKPIGIAILIGIVTVVNRNNQKLAVSGLSQHFQKIFRMVGLAQYADIYQDEDEAIKGFAAATT